MTTVLDKANEANPTSDDVLYLINNPSGTPGDRKLTVANLVASAPFTGAFVVGQTDAVITKSARIPFGATEVIDGPTVVASGSSNVVGFAFNPEFAGNFTGITGSDAGSVWGFNVFALTGDTAGDVAGLTNINGGLIELAVRTPSGTIPVARGFMAEVSLYGATAGATITQAESLRVGSPKLKEGAGGSITNAYSLVVEEAAVGTGAKFSLLVAGGVSRFGGRVDITNDIANNGSGPTTIYGGFSTSDGARLTVEKNADGGDVQARMANSGAEFQVHDNSAVTWSVSRTGLPKWNAAANQQTTVGAAGGASALPATPTTFLKVVTSGGTTLCVPAYAV